MTVSIESFGGKPYKAIVEVLERYINEIWFSGMLDDLNIGFGAVDRKLKNIEMTDDGYIKCDEYRYIAIMPYFSATITVEAGDIGTLNLENQLYVMLREGSYSQGVHQASMFPGHYEYDNSSGSSDYSHAINSTNDFNHPDYYNSAQIFKLPGNQILLNIHLTKQHMDTANHIFRLILWLIP